MDSLSDLLSGVAPKAIAVLVRRFGDFVACEDAVQDALLAAATQWPVHGVPDNPTGSVVTVASRRRIEQYRADEARRRRAAYLLARDVVAEPDTPETDDALTVLVYKSRGQLLHGWPALSDHDGYRGCIVAQMPAGKSRDLVEQAAQHAVSSRRAMSNNRFQKAIVAELEAF